MGREFVSFPSLSGFSAASSSSMMEGLDALKTELMNNTNKDDLTTQMLDRLHGTAFQGNSLANPLNNNSESLSSVTSSDVSSMLAGVKGGDVVVVGAASGGHDKLVEEVEKVLGGLEGGKKGEVGALKEKAYFVGSDIR